METQTFIPPASVLSAEDICRNDYMASNVCRGCLQEWLHGIKCMQRISAGVTAWHQMYGEDICRSDCMASNVCRGYLQEWLHGIKCLQYICRSDYMASSVCRGYLQEWLPGIRCLQRISAGVTTWHHILQGYWYHSQNHRSCRLIL